MKKIVVFLLSVLFVTGCTNKISLNMELLKKEINSLTSNDFDINEVIEKLESKELGYFTDLNSLYLSDLEQINVDSSYVSDMLFRVKQGGEPAYIIIKPTDGNKEKLTEQLESYVVNYLYEVNEYEGYLIYLFDSNKQEILEQIKKIEEPLFKDSYYVNDNSFEKMIGFNPKGISEYLISIPIESSVERYFIIKPKTNYKRLIKAEMKKYFNKLSEEWSSNEETSLIENRMEKEYGDYLVYIISKDNDSVFKVIKESKK